MNILFDDYHNYIFNENLDTHITYEFMKKHSIILFSQKNECKVYLIKNDFNYFAINKLNFFDINDIIICVVENNVWNKYIHLLELNFKQRKAINNYKFNNSNLNSEILDVKTTFYQADIENAPVVKLVDSIIAEAIMLKSSDIHIEPSVNDIVIRYRIDGKLIEKNRFSNESLGEIVSRIKVLSNLDITKKMFPQDGKLKYSFNNMEYDIRVSIIPTIYGERTALRILDASDNNLTFENLGFKFDEIKKVINLINYQSGLVLVVGPTGSGKSTTLRAFLMDNVKKNENIITVEDPVEYSIPGISQVQINEIGGLTFAECLRSILRQDPNIIMIGEIRDQETAHIACRSAVTGHLVYSTLHTNSSIGAIPRLLDMGIEPYLIVDAVRGIISQRLIRVLCPKCKEKYVINNTEAVMLNLESETSVFRARGCPYCNMTGYSGRRAIYEILMIDDDFKELITAKASITKFNKLFEKKKISSLFSNGRELVLNGITSIDELSSNIDINNKEVN